MSVPIKWVLLRLPASMLVASAQYIEKLESSLILSCMKHEELARYLFVWAMYLSISYCIRDDRHIRIRVFIDKLPGNWTQFSLIVSDLIYLAFSATVAWFGFKVINRSLQLGQIAPAMEIPIACLYASVLVCAILSCVRLVTSIYQRTSTLSNTSERIRFSRQRYRHLKAKYRTSNRLLELNA